MKRHIFTICAIALAAMAANAGTLTVTHTEQGKLSDEVAAAVAADETLATAADITVLKIVSPVVDEVAANVVDADFTYLRTLAASLVKLDLSEAAFANNKLPGGQWDSEGTGRLRNMTALEEVVLPDDIAGIGGATFTGCEKLKKINLNDKITVLPQHVFRSCVALELDMLPAKLSIVEPYAFYQCANLKLSEIPSTVTKIRGDAFNESNVAFTTLPAGLIELGERAFRKSNVAFSEIPQGIKTLPISVFAATKCTFTTFPEHVTSISTCVLQSVKTITEFEIPNRCNLWTKIPDGTFYVNESVNRTFTLRAPAAPTCKATGSNWDESFGKAAQCSNTTMKVLASAKASFETTAPYSSMKLEVLTTEVPEPELILAEGVEDGHVSVKFVVADADHTDFSKVYEGEGKFVVSFSDDAHEGCHVASIRYSDAASYAPRRAEAEEVEGEDPAEEDPDLLYAVDNTIDNLKKTVEVPVTVAPGMRQLSVEVGRLTDEQISGVRQAACTAKAAVKRCGNDIYVTVAGAALYDTAGRCVLSTTGNCLSVESLPAGCYILRAHGTAAKIIR